MYITSGAFVWSADRVLMAERVIRVTLRAGELKTHDSHSPHAHSAHKSVSFSSGAETVLEADGDQRISYKYIAVTVDCSSVCI